MKKEIKVGSHYPVIWLSTRYEAYVAEIYERMGGIRIVWYPGLVNYLLGMGLQDDNVDIFKDMMVNAQRRQLKSTLL